MKWDALGIMPRMPEVLKQDGDVQEAMMKVPQDALPHGIGGAY